MGVQETFPQFSYISTGSLNSDDTICISNTNLLDYLTQDDIFEMTTESMRTQEESDYIIENLLSSEIREIQTDIILLFNPEKNTKTSLLATWDTTPLKNIFVLAKNKGKYFYNVCK